MTDSSLAARLSRTLVSRRGAWVSLGVALTLLVALFGLLGQAKAPTFNAQAPSDSESSRVTELLEEFPNADQQPVLIVAERDGGGTFTPENVNALERVIPSIAEHAAADPTGPLLSEGGEAAVIVVPMTVGETNTDTAEVIAEIRSTIADVAPTGLQLLLTGGPAFGADVASAFDGADFTLLVITILIVAILLIATYRSPVLWLIPLAVVGIADGLAGRATAHAASVWDLQFDSGIISVLVFGAGTNYALLFISRYREELRQRVDHRDALSTAWRHTMPAILASNVTVVLALLTLVLAAIPGTQGLGVSSAIGLFIALGAVLFILPPVLAACGRKVFWPFIPRPTDTVTQAGTVRDGRGWRAVATSVSKRPGIALGAGLGVLLVMATGLFGTSVGLDQIEKFRVQSESATGLQVLSEHFPAGEAQPIWVVAQALPSEDVVSAIHTVPGVVRAHPAGISTNDTLVKIMVTSEYSPGTEASLAQIDELRDAVHDVSGADALVGGAVATDVDARAGNLADLLLIAPLVLLACFLVLLALLRSFLAPILLLLVNLTSAVAAIGAGAWLSRVLFDQPALDLQVPLLSFLFLVALGIDYTIFLVHRARTETRTHGTKRGMIEAVTHTGGVITSAGIVLAAVFAALGVLPLVTLGQLGLIVGLGVVVDTLLVRTVIVPAIFTLVGQKIWWPGKIQ